ncbi:uncharacterized protein Z519_11070 [Cladophialophora bantiana CBS 173.52]|uniref:TRUD domain-containing protein n=1 Tax=Cladophialophora bantiana (strain ATCC 10958 / CBS 173.52 / CDC B-1940 / NIH 8579) TaxID=1442370 RepID=A0A0D2EEL3_CLAB1|nr:uncharacterized protein Z519_11070 [Cladophialophora bantiana CBS 173.52]KIW88501.1 hypothetical protein Z519_11070 [Cladophialophora bantiana CBS 173.52]
MEDQAVDTRPQKRVKLDTDQVDLITLSPDQASGSSTIAKNLTMDDGAKECEVGITAFVDGDRSLFRGILKKRYTDFMVNEILPCGTVLHLRSMSAKGLQVQNSRNNGAEAPVQDVLEHARHEAVASEPPTAELESKETGIPGKAKSLDDSKEDDIGIQNPEVNSLSLENLVRTDELQISADDRVKLLEYFSEEIVAQMISLYESILRNPGKKSREYSTVRTAFTSDRSLRSKIHQEIRRIFRSKIDSTTDNEGILVLTATAMSSNNSRNRGWTKPKEKSSRPGKLSWLDRGGEYIHFTLYKENKDTLEVISYLTKQLKTNNKTFQFAGTKDRRAVTVQRASAYRIEAERLAALNRTLRYAAVGDFEYQKRGLELGDLTGNEFVVTLRDCHLDESTPEQSTAERKAAVQSYLSRSLHQLYKHGFLNYYGLQRFGTFATRTDVVGLKILKDDFKGACDAILEFSPVALNKSQPPDNGVLVSQDDRSRAEGINIWRTTGRINDALDKIPRKFSAETALIRHLGKRPQDYLGALLGIQRNLRLMYVHAYQSFVWNLAVGERWRLFGGMVVEGDLVLVHEHREKQIAEEPLKETVDADGEVVIEPSGDDRAYDVDDRFERARALSAAEVDSGQYSIFDIVLPLPGFDVVYPANASGEWYKTFMASEAGGRLDPYNMRRKQKDFSLSGGYRKVLARIGETFEVSVHEYGDRDSDKQFVETDMERIQREKLALQQEEPSETAANEGPSRTPTTDVVAVPDAAEQQPQQPPHGADAKDSDNNGEIPKNTTPPPPSSPTLKLAAVLKFQLGSSQYATMALRELSNGGIQAYKAEFTGGR